MGYKSRKVYGGEKGIRTLDTVTPYTRLPIVRFQPSQPSLQKIYIFQNPFLGGVGGEKGIRTPEEVYKPPARFRVECIQPDSAISPYIFILPTKKERGGEKGIRTLDTVTPYTRLPIVRFQPSQPSLHEKNAT